jgi:hypothetical protein
MTASELRSIVGTLANSCHVRYWLHYNYPAQNPLMAISVIDTEDLAQLNKELIGKGFKRVDNESYIWTVERTDLTESMFL